MVLTNEVAELPVHLEYEQLSAYVLGALDEVSREIANNHLAACEFCAGEIQALATLQTELQGLLPQTQPPTTVPAQPSDPTQTSWWTSFKQ